MYNNCTPKQIKFLEEKMKRSILFSTLLALALVVAACAPQATPTTAPPTPQPEATAMPEVEEPMADTIVDVASQDGRFTTLVAALQSADLADTLKGEGPFTVFAPTDDAFAKLPAGTVDALLADKPSLTNILLYHVVAGQFMASDVVGLNSATTLQGEDVSITVDGDIVTINDAQVIITDIQASNGVIHVIDTVLLPPQETIVDIAVADGRFTTLVAALDAAGLVETLQGEGPFTVFAPTDDAFAKLPAGTVDALLADIPTLTNILLYHVVPGRVMAADVVGLTKAETVEGQDVMITVDGDKVMVDGAQIILTDIEGSNGVIHVIDSVLLPATQDIPEVAIADGRFTTLVAALQAAGLVETLQGDGPFTVFAPTDDAFAALPDGTVEALLNDIPALTEILLYHVVPGEVFSNEVVSLNYADTVQGQPVFITTADGMVMINDANVIIPDVRATNGVIHVIDKVILPPSMNIVETAVADGRFTTLVAALQAAGLAETLQGDGPFTVFAPTDDAFNALPAGTVEALLNDIPALTDILLYHVVGGRVLAADVIKLDSAVTLQGDSVTISVVDGKVMINDAEVILTDILTTNGVIHVIDTVILPGS
jgi:transforming growth factor-beta-induced protein